MKRSAKISICPDCNTTLSFINNDLTQEELLIALEILMKEVKDNNIDIHIYNDKLRKININGS